MPEYSKRDLLRGLVTLIKLREHTLCSTVNAEQIYDLSVILVLQEEKEKEEERERERNGSNIQHVYK